MKKFYKPSFEANRDDLMGIDEHEMAFPYVKYLKGELLTDDDIKSLKLFTNDSIEKANKTHVVGNAMGAMIYSDTLLNYIYDYIKEDAQIFKIDIIHKKTGNKIKGFNFIHPTTIVKCVDMEKSKYEIDEEDNTIDFKLVILDITKIPESLHIFRLEEQIFTKVVSEDLVKPLVGKKMEGICLFKLFDE